MMTLGTGKVLYLHRTQGGGVEEVHISGVARAFETAGIAVDILSPRSFERLSERGRRSDEVGQKTDKSRLTLISRYAPELLFELMEIIYNLVALYKLTRRGVKNYDLVFERYSIFGVVGALLAKYRKLPFVLEVNYTSNSPLVRRRSALLKPLARITDRWVFRTATLITPVSSALRDELVQRYGVPVEKALVLPNAADPANFKTRDREHFFTRTKTIGFVGGFYLWHGLDILIKAFATIAGSFPEARVLLIGDGPELEKTRLLVAELRLSKQVIFGGRKMHHELPKIMSEFYLGVMPDSNDYGSPMKIFEYMALGLPVVAPDYGPIHDAITNGKQGLIFERRNISALAEALAKLLSDRELAESYGSCGRATVVSERNWNANVSKILAALAGLGQQGLATMRT